MFQPSESLNWLNKPKIKIKKRNPSRAGKWKEYK